MGLVAMEQIKFPRGIRVLDDDLAWPILPFGARAAIRVKAGPFSGDFIVKQAEKRVPGLWGSIMCRKRYIDDKVSETVSNGEVAAVVNLGAGYDTRPYRLPALQGIPVFELDQPKTIEDKRSRLTKLFGTVPDHVTLASIDLERQKLETVLESSGWKADWRSFFILEGVTQYLTEASVRSTFDLLAGTAPGSRLVFTYVCREFIDGQVPDGQEFLYRKMIVKDRMWLYGMDPDGVPDFLDGYGWTVLEHYGYEDLARFYVKPTGRSLKSMPMERLVYARKGKEDRS
jgi:methyltransferase (TIGR00027 family)